MDVSAPEPMVGEGTEWVVKSPVRRDPAEVPGVALAVFMLEHLRNNLPRLGQRVWAVDVTTGTQVKFCDVESQSRRVASALTRRGFKKGHVLFYVTYDMAHLYVVQLAVWRLGGAVRGWYQTEPTEDYARQMWDAKSQFVLVDAETAPKLQEATASLEWPVVLLSVGDVTVPGATSFSQLLEDDGTALPKKVDIDPREDIVVIVNTSGSTGVPKGVLHTHHAAVSQIHCLLGTNSTLSTMMSLMTNDGMGDFIQTCFSLCSGATVYRVAKFDKDTYFDLLMKYKPHQVKMYPYIACWFSRSPLLDQLDLSFLRAISLGGWVLDPATLALLARRLPHVRVSQVYGMSEGMIITSTMYGENPSTILVVEKDGEQHVSVGRLLPYVKSKVIDPVSGRSLAPGERGEILVHSPYLMKGYLRPGQEPNRSDVDDQGWLHTGDLGFCDDHGDLFIIERLNFMFKVNTANVMPCEIESILQEHEAVQGAGVVGIPHPETDNLARAFVVLRPDCHATAAELQNYVAQRLVPNKQLHGGVRFVEKLPENRGGKLDRAALKKLAMAEQDS